MSAKLAVRTRSNACKDAQDRLDVAPRWAQASDIVAPHGRSKREEQVGAAFAGDGNPRYGKISAYWQGANAAVESMMNVAAVGATPRALTDCPPDWQSLRNAVQCPMLTLRGSDLTDEATDLRAALQLP